LSRGCAEKLYYRFGRKSFESCSLDGGWQVQPQESKGLRAKILILQGIAVVFRAMIGLVLVPVEWDEPDLHGIPFE
jgi:hypothetical protein